MKTLQLDAYFKSFFYLYSESLVFPFPIIYKLHVDLFVDHIFIHLCVEDILALRQVNKPFYLLTLTPVIWQRFLERMRIPTHPLRQVFRYHFELYEHEAEDLVRRNLCLERNWSKSPGHAVHHRTTDVVGEILEMKLFPGGKYLVASLQEPASMRFYIVIYAMDNPNGPRALVRSQTSAKAYGIQVKYFTLEDHDRIVITYNSTVLRNGAPHDPNQEIDPFNPPTYQVIALHISLHALDLITSPVVEEVKKLMNEQPEPFTQFSEITLDNPIDEVTLFNFHGKPYISVTQNPNRITFFNLLTRVTVTLICKHEPEYMGLFVQLDHIDAVRVLPEQREVLVVRSFLLEDMTVVHVLCMFSLPCSGASEEIQMPSSQYILQGDEQYVNCQISDIQTSTPVNEWTWARRLSCPPRIPATLPPPISIFFRTIESNGIVQVRIFPERFIRKGTRRFSYGFHNLTMHTMHDTNQSVWTPFVLPGAHRAAVFKLWRYCKPQVTLEKLQNGDDGSRADELDHTLLDAGRYVHPELPPSKDNVTRKRFSDGPALLPTLSPRDIIPINANGGLGAFTFDDTIGRLCIVPKLDNKMHVFDFTHLPLNSDERHRRWKRDRRWLLDTVVVPPDQVVLEKTYSETFIRLFFDMDTEETHVVYHPPTPMRSIEELEELPVEPGSPEWTDSP